MGCLCCSEEIQTFDKKSTYEDIVKNINDINLLDDCDIYVFIDCSRSNLYKDGTTEHDLQFPYKKNNIVTNKYIFSIEMLNKLTSLSKTKISKIQCKLFFYGTTKAEKNIDKVEEIKVNYDHETNTIINKDTNSCKNIDELITSYIAGIKCIRNKDLHIKYGANEFHKNSDYTNCVKRALKEIKTTKKFSICYIITNCICNNICTCGCGKKSIEEIFNSSSEPLVIVCICIGDSNEYYETLKSIDKFEYNNLEKQYGSNNNNFREYAKINRKFDNFTVILMKDIIKRPIVSDSLKNEYFRVIFNELPKQYKYIQNVNILNYKPLKYNT
jgi:hypothetical protein